MYDRYLNMKEKNMTNQELIYLCRQLSMLLKQESHFWREFPF